MRRRDDVRVRIVLAKEATGGQELLLHEVGKSSNKNLHGALEGILLQQPPRGGSVLAPERLLDPEERRPPPG